MPSPLSRLKQLNTRECLWIYILAILKEKPTHAYALRKGVQERFGFRPGVMTAYKVLYLLHKDGFVRKARLGRRRVYSLTPQGRAELEKASQYYKNLAKTIA